MLATFVSDLHMGINRDIGRVLYNGEESEILFVAGDISESYRVASDLNRLSEFYPHVIATLGNHDYYGSRLKKWSYDSQLNENVTVLDSRAITVEGLHIVGTPLFTNFNNEDPVTLMKARYYMNDYNHIQGLTPADVLEKFEEGLQFIKDNVTPKTVVMTHHAPSPKSVAEIYKNETVCNGYYFTDLEELILELQPAIWHHGHTHTSFDYNIGVTRVICNPKGYHNENPKFHAFQINLENRV